MHLQKDRFPEKQKSKLLPHGDGPFKVLANINDNAYKIELLGDDYAVSNTFNVADLSPFFGEESESRLTLFEEGEDDEDIPSDEQAKWSLLDEGTYKIDINATSPPKEVTGVKVLWR